MLANIHETPRIRESMRLHRFLRKYTLMPRPVADRIVSAIKIARNPSDHIRRKRLMDLVGPPQHGDQVVPWERGFLVLDPPLPGQAEAVSAAQRAFETFVTDGNAEEALAGANKRFLVSVLRDQDLLEHGEIFRFAISRPVVDMAARYLGRVPVLSSIRLWWTPTNTTARSSQLFHRDGEGRSQLKLFFNVTSVDPDSGPLTIIPADVSNGPASRVLAARGRLKDVDVSGSGLSEHARELTGPAGSGVVVDTSRCLHYGSRGNARERVVLMIQYTRSCSPRAAAPSWGEGLARHGDQLDAVQRASLNLAP